MSCPTTPTIAGWTAGLRIPAPARQVAQGVRVDVRASLQRYRGKPRDARGGRRNIMFLGSHQRRELVLRHVDVAFLPVLRGGDELGPLVAEGGGGVELDEAHRAVVGVVPILVVSVCR